VVNRPARTITQFGQGEGPFSERRPAFICIRGVRLIYHVFSDVDYVERTIRREKGQLSWVEYMMNSSWYSVRGLNRTQIERRFRLISDKYFDQNISGSDYSRYSLISSQDSRREVMFRVWTCRDAAEDKAFHFFFDWDGEDTLLVRRKRSGQSPIMYHSGREVARFV
jgi:hypothetical protein